MSTLSLSSFDTLQYVKRLKAANVPEEQAEAQAEALRTVLHAALFDHAAQLATKGNIALVRKDIELLRWMMGIVIGGIIALMLKSFF